MLDQPMPTPGLAGHPSSASDIKQAAFAACAAFTTAAGIADEALNKRFVYLLAGTLLAAEQQGLSIDEAIRQARIAIHSPRIKRGKIIAGPGAAQQPGALQTPAPEVKQPSEPKALLASVVTPESPSQTKMNACLQTPDSKALPQAKPVIVPKLMDDSLVL